MSLLQSETEAITTDNKNKKGTTTINNGHPYHAHFDCFSGAAGDMLLASCLDASGEGKDTDTLKNHVTNCLSKGIPELADEFEIRTKRVWRGGMGSIAGLHVTVVSKYKDKAAPVPKRKAGGTSGSDLERNSNGDGDSNGGHHHDHHHSHGGHQHEHDHQNDHSHASEQHNHQHQHQHSSKTTSVEDREHGHHNHSHGHSHGHAHGHNHSASSSSASNSEGPLRNLPEIKRLLEESDDVFIDPWVKSMAIATFTELAVAEAATHGADGIESVHFHEVGAVDSIVDTVGTLIALHYMEIRSFSCSRIPIGEGTVWTDHGILPVPAPATLRLLVGMPTCPGPLGVVTGELVTPTGAALLRTLCLTSECAAPARGGRPPSFTIQRIGIGAGTKDFEKHPNILRLLIGDDVVATK
uniref:LarC family nickel insertion protein n=1 Tax=Pseudo-nitzschia australis TaxID=44445 RepID=A0A7S4ER73_9STRA|mmetsp:Transcript_26426/g.57907  ORF Transcript_26426/g.57907 Transcript_26426/m.57907 type:complete len:411 (+) Transcript_26426:116-1348(+)|eukprot:CAMPEP_0168275394 /NCGR_PEP_ID=MMETSP0141_2-20121125/17846_1 /TAXON_ID=44445 /ORGANISM="Pseudo-nitzschia australis, Strain 10249 10 AB" /LENGTH=410 /DNA_ID=CAMNT_0008217121 /DNA_START=81 /DNA_END=1313 /DNA_ORIENTATION=-